MPPRVKYFQALFLPCNDSRLVNVFLRWRGDRGLHPPTAKPEPHHRRREIPGDSGKEMDMKKLAAAGLMAVLLVSALAAQDILDAVNKGDLPRFVCTTEEI